VKPTRAQPVPLLYVDDDEDFLLLLETVLPNHGFLVTTVTSCAAAREALGGQQFPVVVADAALPDGNGISLLAPLRSLRVVVSGAPADSASGGRWDLRFEKPVDVDDLAQSILARL